MGTPRAQLAQWLARGPQYGVAYARAQATWRAAERLKAAPPAIEPETVAGPAGHIEAFFMRRDAVVAMILLSLLAALRIIAAQALTSVDRFHTAIREQRTVRLAGSVMRLNTGSSAEVAIGARRRHVKLIAGEASSTSRTARGAPPPSMPRPPRFARRAPRSTSASAWISSS